MDEEDHKSLVEFTTVDIANGSAGVPTPTAIAPPVSNPVPTLDLANMEEIAGGSPQPPPSMAHAKPSLTEEADGAPTLTLGHRILLWPVHLLHEHRFVFSTAVFFTFLWVVFLSSDALKNIRWPRDNDMDPPLYKWFIFIAMLFWFYFPAIIIERTVLPVVQYISIFFRLNSVSFISKSFSGLLALWILLTVALNTYRIWKVDIFALDDTGVVIRDLILTVWVIVSMFMMRNVLIRSLYWHLDLRNNIDRIKDSQKHDHIINKIHTHVKLKTRARTTRFNRKGEWKTELKETRGISTMLRAANAGLQFVKSDDDGGVYDSGEDMKKFLEGDKLSRLESHQDVVDFAKKLFKGLDSKKNQYISVNDFMMVFDDIDISEQAFRLFAQGSSDIAFQNMEDIQEPHHLPYETFEAALIRLRNSRFSVTSDLHCSSSASSVMRHILRASTYIMVPFIVAAMAGVSFDTIILSTSSILISMSFAFGSSISNLVEAMYFLFVTKPYIVGDLIVPGAPSRVESMVYFVQEIELMTTTTKTPSNKLVIFPNYKLATNPLVNLNRLPNALVELKFEVAASMSKEQFDVLTFKVKSFLQQHRTDWRPSTLDIIKDRVVNLNYVVFTLQVASQFKWQQYLTVRKARSRLMDQVSENLLQLGVEFRQLPVDVELLTRAN